MARKRLQIIHNIIVVEKFYFRVSLLLYENASTILSVGLTKSATLNPTALPFVIKIPVVTKDLNARLECVF